MRAPITCLALTATLLVAPPTGASGERRVAERISTFEGTCQFSGRVTFTPALTNTPARGSGSARAAGRCSGTFTGPGGRTREIERRRVGYVARNQGEISCASGVARGNGALVFRRDRIRFRLEETRAGAAAALDLRGRGGGSATGQARVSESENPAEIAAKCAGPGLRSARIDIDIETTPSISG